MTNVQPILLSGPRECKLMQPVDPAPEGSAPPDKHRGQLPEKSVLVGRSSDMVTSLLGRVGLLDADGVGEELYCSDLPGLVEEREREREKERERERERETTSQPPGSQQRESIGRGQGRGHMSPPSLSHPTPPSVLLRGCQPPCTPQQPPHPLSTPPFSHPPTLPHPPPPYRPVQGPVGPSVEAGRRAGLEEMLL
ncbi:hypothetical protein Q8A73_001190 [Channa argus]|nr:hypothetical protein Q8A73_001190 [Channa argus]